MCDATGMLVLAMSRSINSEMIAARAAVRSVVSLYDKATSPQYIGWHVRGTVACITVPISENLFSLG